MSGAIAVPRGCGTRKAGGVYAETGLSPNGLPVEAFLLDPPITIPEALHLAPQGVHWVRRGDVWHVVDWVGSQHYPNVADFVEEVRRFGLSRRLPSNAEFSRLTAASRIILVHARAFALHNRSPDQAPHPCPKRVVINLGRELRAQLPEQGMDADEATVAGHEGGVTYCAGQWWEQVVGGEVDEATGLVRRTMPSFSYLAKPAADGDHQYAPGFFATFPLSRLVVVRDPAGQKHVPALAAAQAAALPVEEVDQ